MNRERLGVDIEGMDSREFDGVTHFFPHGFYDWQVVDSGCIAAVVKKLGFQLEARRPIPDEIQSVLDSAVDSLDYMIKGENIFIPFYRITKSVKSSG